jgi:alanine-glyoxylate transaminase/serine-glyoxylate transaminase/serine-pyruvate transaminase
MRVFETFNPPPRLLLGPGPSNVAPSVLKAMSLPLIGHLDPMFVQLMDNIKAMLRELFITNNDMTFPVSGTGSAGMEFCMANLVEPGDDVLVAVNGVFGARMADMAERYGGRVTKLELPWGQIVDPHRLAEILKKTRPKLVCVVHAETSTGILTPVPELSRLTHQAGALFLLDTVTSLGGCPVHVDEWEVDAVFSGTQKCLSCPPGLSPVSLNARAMEKAKQRKSKVQSWYLDVNLLATYWGQERAYHHTAPINMNYALYEALRIILTEGLQQRWKRHQRTHLAFKRGLAELGLELAGQPGHELWTLNAVRVPVGADPVLTPKRLLSEYNIEIGAGLGPMKGQVWRVGFMGENSTEENVHILLKSLRHLLRN